VWRQVVKGIVSVLKVVFISKKNVANNKQFSFFTIWSTSIDRSSHLQIVL